MFMNMSQEMKFLLNTVDVERCCRKDDNNVDNNVDDLYHPFYHSEFADGVSQSFDFSRQGSPASSCSPRKRIKGPVMTPGKRGIGQSNYDRYNSDGEDNRSKIKKKPQMCIVSIHVATYIRTYTIFVFPERTHPQDCSSFLFFLVSVINAIQKDYTIVCRRQINSTLYKSIGKPLRISMILNHSTKIRISWSHSMKNRIS